MNGETLIDVNRIMQKAQVGDRMKVADLGCGASGYYVFAAAKLVGKNGKVYAVDILRNILENLGRRARQENLVNILTVWTDLEIFGATKIESSSLDVGFLINTLYQSHKRAEIIRESVRLLKKNAVLMIVEWRDVAAPFGPPVEERVKKDLLTKAAPKFGLNLEEEFEAGPYHYGLLFRKI